MSVLMSSGRARSGGTGATRTHIGRFEQANGGTLVLDELGTIPPRMQEKILRVIEYGEFQRVGGSETLTTDVRIVGATNEHLPRLAELGRFRADLLDRLAFDVVHVPPLRARPEDINTLAYHFAVNVTKELQRSFFPGFTADAKAALLGYAWPGNVRELKNAVERSVYRAEAPEQPIATILFDPFASPYNSPALPQEPVEEEASPQPRAAAPCRYDRAERFSCSGRRLRAPGAATRARARPVQTDRSRKTSRAFVSPIPQLVAQARARQASGRERRLSGARRRGRLATAC